METERNWCYNPHVVSTPPSAHSMTLLAESPELASRWKEHLAELKFSVDETGRSKQSITLVLGRFSEAAGEGDLSFEQLAEQCRHAMPTRPFLIGLFTPNEQQIAAALVAGAEGVFDTATWRTALPVAVHVVDARSSLGRTARHFQSYGRVLRKIVGAEIRLDALEVVQEVLQELCDIWEWKKIRLLVRGGESRQLYELVASDEVHHVRIPFPETAGTPLSDALHHRRVSFDASPTAPVWIVPLVRGETAMGALYCELKENHAPPEYIHDTVSLMAVMILTSLRDGRVFEHLNEQTNRYSLDAYKQERLQRSLEQYHDFWETSVEGVIIVGNNLHVIYLNPVAEKMTGYAEKGLRQYPLTSMVSESQRSAFAEILAMSLNGLYLEPFDVQLTTTSGELITINMVASPALAEQEIVVLTFRDVTEQRALESELKKTKEFLERLIDSTVDGIVAADLRGQVIIFNQGAARLSGYTPEEVIGKIPVWKLYPEGRAKEIMSALRTAERGGAGRLEPSRHEILSKTGERIPVSLAASLVYERGHEIASVGIFSDMREKLTLEQRLARAQQKLELSEKQALLAQLAGTTAHELNQPLTSILGYAQLLKRRADPTGTHYSALSVIAQEAERMADIVRKIGKITRYETKAYVGSAQILDLEKSTKIVDPEFPVDEGENKPT